VRAWCDRFVRYRSLCTKADFSRCELSAAPFSGLAEGGMEAVVGLLRCCVSDLHVGDAAQLRQLPIVPTADGELVAAGADGTADVVVTTDVAVANFLTGGAVRARLA
jgi:hypothetical protein